MVNRIGLCLFFLSGTVIVMQEIHIYQKYLLVLGLVFIATSRIRGLKIIPKVHDILNVSFLGFVSMCFVSYLYNAEFSMLVTSIGLLFMWCVVTMWQYNNYMFYMQAKSIYALIYIPYFIIMLYSMSLSKLEIIRYEGIFTTSTGTGVTAASIFAVGMALIIYDLTLKERINVLKILFDFLLLAIPVFFAFISTCRSAIISIAIMVLLGIYVVIKKNTKGLAITRWVFLLIIWSIIILLLLYKFTILNDFVANIIMKFEAKSNDTLDGRLQRWKLVLERIRLFGNGEMNDIAAHNTYFSLLDQYGVFACLFWIVFSFAGLIKSFEIAFDSQDYGKVKYFPLFSFTAFILMSMTEGMMMKTIMLMCIYSIPIISFYKDNGNGISQLR